MTALAVVLVLAAAVMHATWNLLAKRAAGGVAFVWLFCALSVAAYAPVVGAFLLIQRPFLSASMLIFMCGTGILHMTYFVLLQLGYQVGDLSVVYPLARGSGPLLSTVAAIAFFGERPAPVAVGGALLIALGVIVLTSGRRTWQGAGGRGALLFGLLTGITIAAYTLWDKHAVSVALVPPLLLDWASQVGQLVLLGPYAYRHRDAVRVEWVTHRREAVAVAILAPLAYLLVLTALVFTPVSYIAPAREISILIGAAMGARLLAEGDSRRRMVAACAMVAGILALVAG